jgi:hypothetical protein
MSYRDYVRTVELADGQFSVLGVTPRNPATGLRVGEHAERALIRSIF